MCSRSPSKIGLPLMKRRAIVTPVSNTGSAKARIGIATATVVEAFCPPSTESAARVKPTKSAPESPRKIEAGLKLYRRKPVSAPKSTSATTDTNGRCRISDSTRSTSDANRAAPVASPSIPSIRLKALAIPTTQNTVSANPITGGKLTPPMNGIDSAPMRPPMAQKSAPINPSVMNFILALAPRKSS